MLQEISNIEDAEAYVMNKLEHKERVMGFGHRVYKTYDPRATYLKTFAEAIAQDTGNLQLFNLSKENESIMAREVGPKGIYPNVDFYSGIIYRALGIPTKMFTVMFSLGRLPGWISQWQEMRNVDKPRIYRARQIYMGAYKRDFIPIEKR